MVSLFLIILTGSRILWIMSFNSADYPPAVNGELDIREWDGTAGGTIALDGQWAFYPNVWLMEGPDVKEASSVNGHQYIHVPGRWDAYMRPEGGTPYGYGSFRLRVYVNPEADITYSIRIPSVRSSSELFVNGRLLAKSGQPAASEEAYSARNVPYTASFTADENGLIDIVVQAANYTDPRKSGIVRSIKFGSEEAIDRETRLSMAMQQVVAIAFLIHVVYVVILYLLGYREKKLLYFALLVVSTVLSILIGGDDKILLYWIPIGLEWSLKLMFLFVIVGTYSLLQCIVHRLPGYWRTKISPGCAVICGAALVSMLFLSADKLLVIHNLFLTVLALVLLFASLLLLRSTGRGFKDNVLLLLSLVAFGNNLIWWGILLITGIKIIYYPFDLLVATTCFASVWIGNYLQIHTESKSMTAKLQRADKLKDEFLANTSHELRTPLNGILNISQAVLEREKHTLSAKSVKDLEMAMSVGRRMALMLNELLDMMRLKESNPRLQLRSFSIRSVVTGVMDMLRFMPEGKPVIFVNHIPENFPQVLGDENRVIQIMFNLLHNAVKFTNEGEVSIRAEIKEGRAHIAVSDTGIGMDEEMMRRVFEPYEQAYAGETMIEGGFGLGLSISKQLAELHGGKLQVSSTPGRGSVFTFTLQLSDSAKVRTEIEPAILASLVGADLAASSVPFDTSAGLYPAATTDKPRIIIVDDDPVNLNVLEIILSPQRYDIVRATSGKEALVLLGSQEWDLVIADVMMPNMSGYELTRTIRKRYSITELPVLLLTARSQPEDIQNGFLSGANDYVTKPVDAMELRSRVQALTEVKKSARDRLRMEAAWLQAQIEPHFLFNTLNTVTALSEFDINRMRRLLDVFGSFLQDKFNFQNIHELVPLEYEISLVRSYLFIEQERFDDRLNVAWEADECGQYKIPPLTIQPLVENAVKHGIMKRSRGGNIQIRISDKGAFAEISVTDDGVGMDEGLLQRLLERQTDHSTGIGLLNTDLRLKRHFGRGLQIESKPGGGTTISFTVYKDHKHIE